MDFAAEPGERLLLQLLDVDVRTGFYRLAVLVGSCGDNGRCWQVQGGVTRTSHRAVATARSVERGITHTSVHAAPLMLCRASHTGPA